MLNPLPVAPATRLRPLNLRFAITPFARIRLALGMLLLATHASAGPITLREAAEAALIRNSDLAISQARVQQAEAAIRQAEGARLPNLGLGFSATRSNDALGVFGFKLRQRDVADSDFLIANINEPGALSNFNTYLEIQAPLYTGGLITSRIEQARAQTTAARQGDESVRQQIIQQTLEAYQGVHAARAYIKVSEEGIAAAEEYVRVAERLQREGVAIKSDVLSARVHMEEARVKAMEARRMEAGALDRLKVLTGRPLNETIDVGPEVIPTMPEGDVEALRQRALAEHPGLKAVRSQLDAARARIDGARAGGRPQVSLMGRQDWNDNKLGLDASSYTVGGVLSWKVFDGGVTGGAVDQAQAEHQESAARLRQAEDEIGLMVAEARRRALEAESRIAAREAAVAQAEEAQRLIRKRYENGVTTLVELLNGQAQLDRARADWVAARRDLAVARAELRRAVGILTVEQL